MSNVSSASIAGQLGTDSIATTKIAGGALPTDVTVASANIVDGTIVNADVNASAAIAGTKINPNFGSQNIATTGTITASGTITSSGNRITISGTDPALVLTDDQSNPDYEVRNQNSVFRIFDVQGNSSPLVVNGHTDGHMDINVNADFSSGIDVTGNITCTGTVDGRDVAADGTKLDGIESGSTGDQTAAEIRTLVESASDSNVFTDADHSKLNGIESGATADQSASEILTLIKTVDGSGSGLDADSVDGISGQDFLRSDSADTAAGDITFSGGAGAVHLSNGSDIRFDNASSWSGEYSGKIQYYSGHWYFQAASNFHFRNSGGSNIFYVDSSGNAVASGNVTAYSDARLKTDISTINDALGICGKLRGVSYKWIADGKSSIGVIAQEVEEVLPELVLTNQDVNPVTQEITEVKSVDYGKIVGVLINAINELKAEVDELKGGK